MALTENKKEINEDPVTDGGVAESGKSDGSSGVAEAGGVLFSPEDIGAAGRFLPAMITLALILAVASAVAAVVSVLRGARRGIGRGCHHHDPRGLCPSGTSGL